MGTRVPGPGLNSSELDDFTLDTGTLVEIVLQTAINGRQLTGTPISNSHQVILHGVEEIRRNNRAEFESMCSHLEFSSANIYLRVQQIFEGIFDDNNINWGRIGVLLAFGGHLAQHCLMNSMGEVVESLTPWMVAFICTRLREWILEHGGWVGISVALCRKQEIFVGANSVINFCQGFGRNFNCCKHMLTFAMPFYMDFVLYSRGLNFLPKQNIIG